MNEFDILRERLATVLSVTDVKVKTTEPSDLPPAKKHTLLPFAEISTDFLPPNMDVYQEISRAANRQSIISTSDLSGNITFVNDNFVKISKYSRTELIGAPHSLLRSDYHPNLFFEHMWQKIGSGQIWQGTIKNKAKDGSHYWVKTLTAPVKDRTGKISGYISIRHDVSDLIKLNSTQKRLDLKSRSMRTVNKIYSIDRTDRKLPDVLLESLEILFEAPWLKILEKGGVFLANKDKQQLDLVANYQMGPDIASLCNKIAYGHCLCGRAAETKKAIFASCVDGRHEVRFQAMRPHGHYNVPILVGKELIGVLVVYLAHGTKKNPDEEEFLTDFAHTLGVIISFHRRENELLAEKQRAMVAAGLANDAMLEAQAAEQAKTNFLATMSHELRTPLNGVVGMLHAVKLSPLNEEQLEDIDVAMSSADMLLTILNDILDFSKLEYGSVAIEILPIDIRKLVKDSMSPFLIAATDKGLDLTRYIDPEVPNYVLGDPTRLRQISTNLVSNAIKFTEKGSIHISTEICDPPDTSRQNTKWAITKVTDTGLGIPQEARARIFERFTQADETTTRRFGGTGLGLAICKQLVELMGGEIGITSTLGKGSCFWFKLPVYAVDQDGNPLK